MLRSRRVDVWWQDVLRMSNTLDRYAGSADKLQLENVWPAVSNYTYNYLASGNAAHGTGPTVHADLEPTRCTLRPRISGVEPGW